MQSFIQLLILNLLTQFVRLSDTGLNPSVVTIHQESYSHKSCHGNSYTWQGLEDMLLLGMKSHFISLNQNGTLEKFIGTISFCVTSSI